MAAVLDALVPYVKKLINDMAQEEVRMLPGVSGEITRLESNMESIQAFVADAERRCITEARVQRWAGKLRDAMYDATDILDLCQLKADKRSELKDSSRLEEKVPAGCFQPLLFDLRNPLFAHDIGSRIKALNQQLEDIQAYMLKFDIKLVPYPEPRTSELSGSNNNMRSESDIVGEHIERNTRELAQLLTTSDHDIKVVSIVGPGGMGKTTLARKIFNELIIQEHFRTRIWLSITQHFGECELLRSAITQASGSHGGECVKSILTNTLVHILSAGRFLLVMDDVWSVTVWNDVLSVPVRNASQKQPGSWVLVTTRMEDIARQMGATFYQHHVSPLDMDDAWSLLKKQLPPDQVDRVDQLNDIGMKILVRCAGVPLAIKLVGGLLSTRYPSEHEWASVLNNSAWSLTGLPPGLPAELACWLYSLIYQDLTPQLKQCFLYCSLFPEGQEIIQETVTEMWVSEGFIQPPDENSTTSSHEHELEDIAIGNYLELMKRNLIEPISSTTGYMCTMHGVVHSFAQYMARGEALVVQRGQQIESTGGQSKFLRRLSIESTVSIPVEWAALQKLVSLRVLIINCESNFKPGDSLGSFSSLRVLHMVRLSESDRLVSSLCQLKHLRYLYLYDSDISRLPSDIDRMKFLQHIEIVNCEKFVQLPGNIIKLRQPRSHDLVGSSVDVIPRGFGSLTNLRSLFGFPVHTDTDDMKGQGWCSLGELVPLYQLRSLRLQGIEKVDASYLSAAEDMVIISKNHLSYLHLSCNNMSTETYANVSDLKKQQQLIEEVYEHLTPPPCLETLVMEEYIGRRLPNWMWAPKAAVFVRMRYLRLHNLASCTLLPDGLCQMPTLERLRINKAPHIRHVGPEFLHHRSLGYAFPRLQELVLYDMVDWSEWEWNDDVQAMPALEVLLLKSCKLRDLPPGLSYHARALRRLVITGARLLESLENFSSLVELDIWIGTKLSRIANLPRLQKLTVKICPKLIELEGVPSLDSFVVEDYRMEILPGYLECVCPRYLTLYCTIKLLESIYPGSTEWKKISHIRHVNLKPYAEDGDYPREMEAMLDSEDAGTDILSVSTEVDSEPVFPENDSELVGIEKPREEIIKMLMCGQDTGKKQLQVVSICGIGGLGKTSIAKAIYEQIRNQFECCAFVLVSQRHADNKGIIEDIFDQVGCPYPSQQPIEQLIAQLKEFLQDKRGLCDQKR
ncbi:disease resistance protein RGA2-like isoform X2 [Miscanthus floridulus]|uniref:disease resistance protein RGA2-like isoform X2 n=1 Tax=Miscanthus floridulus TaxID=154761 RepID=UPI00345ADE71